MSLLLNSILVNDDLQLSVGHLLPDENTTEQDYYKSRLLSEKVTRFDKNFITTKNTWNVNTVLNEYPHKQSHYLVDNKVYICIQNNKGGLSTEKPTSDSLFHVKLSDGYVWRYIFTVHNDDMLDYIKIYDGDRFSINGVIAKLEDDDFSGVTFKKKPTYHIHTTNGNGCEIIFDYGMGKISNAYVSNGGNTYNGNDVILFTDGDSGDGADIKIAIVDGAVTILSYEIGGNFTDVNIFVIGDGTGATITSTVIDGSLTEPIVTNGGTGYTYAKAIITGSKNSIVKKIVMESVNGFGYNQVDDFPCDLLVSKTVKVKNDTDINYILLNKTPQDNEIPSLYVLNTINTKNLSKSSDNRIQVVITEE